MAKHAKKWIWDFPGPKPLSKTELMVIANKLWKDNFAGQAKPKEGPTVFLAVGPPASGKSTYLKKWAVREKIPFIVADNGWPEYPDKKITDFIVDVEGKKTGYRSAAMKVDKVEAVVPAFTMTLNRAEISGLSYAIQLSEVPDLMAFIEWNALNYKIKMVQLITPLDVNVERLWKRSHETGRFLSAPKGRANEWLEGKMKIFDLALPMLARVVDEFYISDGGKFPGELCKTSEEAEKKLAELRRKKTSRVRKKGGGPPKAVHFDLPLLEETEGFSSEKSVLGAQTIPPIDQEFSPPLKTGEPEETIVYYEES